jgi:hypothetical protein
MNTTTPLDGLTTATGPRDTPSIIELEEAAEPVPLGDAAYHGIAGDLLRLFEHLTEGHPAAILVQFLIAFGNVIGRNCYFTVGTVRHYPVLFGVVVGKTARARKGTSLDPVRHLLSIADPEYWLTRKRSGVSSGEGVIYAVRDPVEEDVVDKKTKEAIPTITDSGVKDKRLLLIESEFAKLLNMTARDGNILSAVLRDAWDFGDLATLTKHSPMTATGAHISLIGHVTIEELLKKLSDTEVSNGLANRFLWVYAYRTKLIPIPQQPDEDILCDIVSRLKSAISSASTERQIRFTEDARAAWCRIYTHLEDDSPGMVGNVTTRSSPIVIRLALVFALLDEANAINIQHLRAALAVWQYCEDSASFIFGRSSSDPVADEILKSLLLSADGLTRTDISALFSRNHPQARILHALTTLELNGKVTKQKSQDKRAGRPVERWFAVRERTSQT